MFVATSPPPPGGPRRPGSHSTGRWPVLLAAVLIVGAAAGCSLGDGGEESSAAASTPAVDGASSETSGGGIQAVDPTDPTTAIRSGGVTVAPIDGSASTTTVSGSSSAPTSTDPSSTTSTTAPTSTAPTSATPSTTGAPDAADLAGWLGAYRWSESAAGLSGVAQIIEHEVTFEFVADDGARLGGKLEQNGFQTSVLVSIEGRWSDGILVVTAAGSDGVIATGDRLFRLSGTPADPTTTLDDLPTLIVDQPRTGRYFERR